MTLRELASRLGLGKSTVADALRGKPGVSPATRARVLEGAREFGYVPNPLTSALLRQVRARTTPRVRANVALVLDINPSWQLPHLLRLCRGFRERADQSGLAADEINTWGVPSDRVMRVLLSRGIEGLAILPLDRPRGHRTLEWSKFTAVTFGYSMIQPRLSRVVHNHFDGVQKAVRMCRKKGFRRIGMIMTDSSNMRSNRLWGAGFSDSQQQLPPSDQISPLLLPDAELTEARIVSWLKAAQPEVVILHKSDPGRRLPGLLSRISPPAIPVFLDVSADPRFAGIDQRYEDLGAAMADLLTRQLIQNERGIPALPSLTMLEGEWFDPGLERVHFTQGEE